MLQSSRICFRFALKRFNFEEGEMKTVLKRVFLTGVILFLILSIASCNLPFKLVPNAATTPPPAATTPPPSDASAQAVQGTPEPVNAVGLEDIMPVKGSVMQWIDLSDFVYVPEGEFIMGRDSQTPEDFSPEHTVTLAAFWIQQAEVTNQQYAACVAAGACTTPTKQEDVPYWYTNVTKANYPVVGVTYVQAQEYCDYIEGRLPTEAEWEKAARGIEGATYPWGEDAPDCSLLNFDDCLDPSEPENVRSYNNGASEFELMDMSGNVFEWVNDWYADDYYATSPAVNPVGPIDGTKKVLRGGGYASSAEDVDPTMRFKADPFTYSEDRGFRCVLKGDYSSASEGSGASYVPRPCSALPLANNQPQTQPTWTPIPCSPPTIETRCKILDKGVTNTSITIAQKGCLSNKLENIVLDVGASYDCIFGGGSKTLYYNCYASGELEGQTVKLSYCHYFDNMMYQFPPECPAGYVADTVSNFCIPEGPWLPDPPCPGGYEDINGLCLPDYEKGFSSCPSAFFAAEAVIGPNEKKTICIPFEKCLYNDDKNCSEPVCPEGQTYDQANNCCALPAKLQMVCPPGYFWTTYPGTTESYCALPEVFLGGCETVDVTFPKCPTLTPTPTATLPPPPQTSGGCGSNTDPISCRNAGCTWDGDITSGTCIDRK
mgnify:FL=1